MTTDTTPTIGISEEEYRYFAFISYKHEDERWASWLQRKIENYRLPSVIRKSRTDLPKWIRPTFRDKTDLSSGVLDVSIETELRLSKNLIVICSPRSAKSDWVGKEVESFRKMGRWDKIIPFIIEGEPHSPDIEKECFPNALREPIQNKTERDLLGISVKQDGKTKAFVKVIAEMLRIPFDDLWRRHHRRFVKNRIILSTLIVAIISLVLFLSYRYWDYNRIKISYYSDYIEKFGVPQGITPLDKFQVKTRYRCYEFISQYGLVREVRHIDSRGKPQDHLDTEETGRAAVIKMKYRKECKVFPMIQFIDSKNSVAYTRDYSTVMEPTKEQIVAWKGSLVPAEIIEAMKESVYPETIVFSEISHKPPSLPALRMFDFNEDGSGDVDLSDGVRPLLNRGVKECQVVYHPRSGLISEIHFSPTISQGHAGVGIGGILYERDNFGRVTKQMYLGNDLKPFEKAYTGVSAKEYRYNDFGLRIQEKWVDSNGRPIPNIYGVCFVNKEVNDRGFVMTESYGDDKNNPCEANNGVAKIQFDQGHDGHLMRIVFKGLNNEPVSIGDGYSQVEFTYYDNGEVKTKTMFYDTQNLDFSKVRETYGADGELIESVYLDENDEEVSNDDIPM